MTAILEAAYCRQALAQHKANSRQSTDNSSGHSKGRGSRRRGEQPQSRTGGSSSSSSSSSNQHQQGVGAQASKDQAQRSGSLGLSREALAGLSRDAHKRAVQDAPAFIKAMTAAGWKVGTCPLAHGMSSHTPCSPSKYPDRRWSNMLIADCNVVSLADVLLPAYADQALPAVHKPKGGLCVDECWAIMKSVHATTFFMLCSASILLPFHQPPLNSAPNTDALCMHIHTRICCCNVRDEGMYVWQDKCFRQNRSQCLAHLCCSHKCN